MEKDFEKTTAVIAVSNYYLVIFGKFLCDFRKSLSTSFL